MAAKKTHISTVIKKHISRPNVHSKKNTSNLKTSKNYKKLYNGQG